MKNFCFFILLAILAGCSGPEIIEDDDMEIIIREALITQAIQQNDISLRNDTKESDSVDLYQPILERLGYTMADFNHTVRVLATRKSNPLNAILDRVVNQIDAMANSADSRYKTLLTADSIVVAAFTDTLYSSDDTIKGTFKKNIIALKDVEPGNYSVTFNYISILDYRVGSKSITYSAGDTIKSAAKKSTGGNLWIPRNSLENNYVGSFTLVVDFDTLNLRFKEPKVDKAVKYVDSSYVTKVRVIRAPFLYDARRQYMKSIYGKDNYLYKYENKKDSLALRFWSGE